MLRSARSSLPSDRCRAGQTCAVSEVRLFGLEYRTTHISEYPSKSPKKVAISFDHDPILFSTANPADEVFGRHRWLVRSGTQVLTRDFRKNFSANSKLAAVRWVQSVDALTTKEMSQPANSKRWTTPPSRTR